MSAEDYEGKIRMTEHEFGVASHLQATYDHYYDQRSAWRALCAIDKANNIVNLCGDTAHARIVEIGAGEGSVCARLSELGFRKHLTALDISTSAIEAINAQRIPGLEDCRLFDGATVPYADGSFDLAVLSHVIEHVEYPRRLLYEASRVAQHVFVEVPLEDNRKLGLDYVRNGLGHINFYSPRTIRHLVQTCGVEIVSQIVTHPSRTVYSYRHGRWGLPIFLLKELVLRMSPRFATSVWTYHSALIGRGRAHAE